MRIYFRHRRHHHVGITEMIVWMFIGVIWLAIATIAIEFVLAWFTVFGLVWLTGLIVVTIRAKSRHEAVAAAARDWNTAVGQFHNKTAATVNRRGHRAG